MASSHAGSALVVEADPAGGDIAARAGLALDPGLVSLAAAARNGMRPEVLAANFQRFGDGVDLLAGPASPRQATTAIRALAQPLAELFARLDYDLIVIDLGRIDDPTLVLPLLGVADRVVLLLRGTAEDVVAARSRIDELQRHAMLGEHRRDWIRSVPHWTRLLRRSERGAADLAALGSTSGPGVGFRTRPRSVAETKRTHAFRTGARHGTHRLAGRLVMSPSWLTSASSRPAGARGRRPGCPLARRRFRDWCAASQ